MSDKFLPHNTQLQVLRKKNLEVPSRAKRVLESEGYHAVINGYRDPFMANTSPEFMFLPGTHFDEVHALYEFDRDLRNIFLKKILIIEQSVRSSIAYNFSKINRNNNRAYLDFRNFDYKRTHKDVHTKHGSKTKLLNTDVHKVISTLSSKMSNPHNQVIKHYITNHQQVPLWILINTLTLGDLVYLYLFLKPDQRNLVSKDFSVSSNELQWFLEQLKIYRNKCAHEERFYCFKQTWGMIDIFHLHNKMRVYLRSKDSKQFDKKVNDLFKKYSSKFTTIPFTEILKSMGYPTNYI